MRNRARYALVQLCYFSWNRGAICRPIRDVDQTSSRRLRTHIQACNLLPEELLTAAALERAELLYGRYGRANKRAKRYLNQQDRRPAPQVDSTTRLEDLARRLGLHCVRARNKGCCTSSSLLQSNL